MGKLFNVLKYLTALACAWEMVAIFTTRLPTFSRLCGKHPSLALGLLAALVYHLLYTERVRSYYLIVPRAAFAS
jgi:hypothetical protein